MGWAGQVAHMGDIVNEFKILIGKYEGTRPLGRFGHRWEDNSRMLR
jgi:hypothetical protein